MIPNEGKFLLQFSALWCGPCTALTPVLKKIATELDVGLEKIDIDEHAKQASQFQIRSIPTVILFEDGKPVDQFVGAKNEQAIRDFIRRD